MMELAIIGGMAVADRVLLQRNAVTIEDARHVDDEQTVRFALTFSAKRAISSGTLTYSLRSKKRPSAVVTKTRSLDFSKSGLNSEYINFDRVELAKEAGGALSGDWILNVKIERSCSLLNPLYKIFSTVVTYTEEFEIE
ncbi:MAG: hypothetical protein CMJ20_01615 [Phycisphaeraceae bacterium]|nr:hypothetical protein [Phycisphaeraceae bacterium]|tara:strand:- start:1557 stop:1973 length:417 start_codon:yes stop_codon:yes gene_type:complete